MPQERCRVLIIDDHEDTSEMLKLIWRKSPAGRTGSVLMSDKLSLSLPYQNDKLKEALIK